MDKDAEKLIESEYCECSLMQEDDPEQKKKRVLQDGTDQTAVDTTIEELIPRQNITAGQGHCPFPDQKLLNRYIDAYGKIIKASVGVLHTNDRYNLKAQLEKLVLESGSGIENQTWAEAVQTNFEIHNWPFIQSN